MIHLDDAHRTNLTVTKDERFVLNMTSRAGVDGAFPGFITIRAMPDRPPVARLLQPDGDLRLHPRDILPLSFQALDDYGVARLWIDPQINARNQPPIAIPLKGDPRRQEGSFDLDLAQLKLNIGDVLSFAIVAQDGSGQKAISQMRHVLVSPRSIDLNAHQRLSSLKESANLASSVADALNNAHSALEDAARIAATRPAESSSVARAYQHIANVTQSAELLRAELLSALGHSSSPQLTTLLANDLDFNALIAGTCEQASGFLGEGRTLPAARQRIEPALTAARVMQTQLTTLAHAEQASALLADRANLRTAQPPQGDPVGNQRLRETLDRAQKDFNAAAIELGLKPEAPDLEALLQQRVAQGKTLLAEARPLDLVELARQWTLALAKGDQANLLLPVRLDIASSAQATRPDVDLVHARDLQLCSRAVRMLEAGAGADRPFFAPALAALEREHDMRIHSGEVRPPDIVKSITDAATEARVKMRRWAAEPDLLLTAAQAIERQRQSLAMEANAAMIARDYQRASQLDQKAGAATLPAMQAVQRVDQVTDSQRQIAGDTAQATAAQATALSDRQRQIAEAIERAQHQNLSDLGLPDSPADQNARQQAIATIQRAQQDLAVLPQRLDEARQAAESLRLAGARLAQLQNAPPGIVDQAKKSVADAQQRFSGIAQLVGPQPASALANDLLQAGPDTSAASQTISESLVPALQSLTSAADSFAMDTAAEQSRRALERIQDQLRVAQDNLIERDPLIAARWFAQSAAAALAQKPPDFSSARRHQQSTEQALSRAWTSVIRQAAAARLAAASTPVSQPPTPSQWGNLTNPTTSIAATPRNAEAPEYQEALNAYFEALSKAGEAPQ